MNTAFVVIKQYVLRPKVFSLVYLKGKMHFLLPLLVVVHLGSERKSKV